MPLFVDVSSSIANSRSRASRKSICAQDKVPTNLYEYALGRTRSHETDLYQARGQHDRATGPLGYKKVTITNKKTKKCCLPGTIYQKVLCSMF